MKNYLNSKYAKVDYYNDRYVRVRKFSLVAALYTNKQIEKYLNDGWTLLEVEEDD